MDSLDVIEGLKSYYNKRDSADKNIKDRIKALEEGMQSLKVIYQLDT